MQTKDLSDAAYKIEHAKSQRGGTKEEKKERKNTFMNSKTQNFQKSSSLILSSKDTISNAFKSLLKMQSSILKVYAGLMLLFGSTFCDAPSKPKNVFQYTIGKNLIRNMTGSVIQRPFALFDELISNSLDANERLKIVTNNFNADYGKNIELHYKSLTKEEALSYGVTIDEESVQIVVVRDYGVGMDLQTLTTKLTSIGTSSNENSNEMIGKFGWGFFSIFKESDTARVRSKAYNGKEVNEIILTPYKNGEFNDVFYISTYEDDNFAQGTEIVCFIKPNIIVDEQKIINRVNDSFINDTRFRNFGIQLLKGEETIQKEFEDRKSAMEKEIEALEKSSVEIDEKIVVLEKEIKEIEEKEESHTAEEGDKKEETNDAVIKSEGEDAKLEEDKEDLKDDAEERKKQSEEKEKKLNEILKLTEQKCKEIEKRTELQNSLKDFTIEKVDIFMPIRLTPWIENATDEQLREIAKEHFGLRDIKLASFTKFSIKDEETKKITDFQAMVFIPKIESSIMQQKELQEGKLDLFVQGCRVHKKILFKSFSKYCHFIVRSGNCEVNSLREDFLIKSMEDKLKLKLEEKVYTVLGKLEPNELYEYNRYIKHDYLEAKRNREKSVLIQKLIGLLAFETDKEISKLSKFVLKLEKIQENIKKIKEGDNTPADEQEADKSIYEYTLADDIYYTTVSTSMVKNITNPLIDGVKAPFIFINSIIDEQVIQELKDYNGFKITNLSTKTFKNKTIVPEVNGNIKFKKTIDFLKSTLNTYISDVQISEQLIKCPFKVQQSPNAMSSLVKNAIGINDIENNPLRMFFDTKPVLVINTDHEDIIAIENLLSDDTDIAKKKIAENSSKSLFFASSLACGVDFYEKKSAYVDMLNLGKEMLNTEKQKVEASSPNDGFDFGKLFGNTGMNNDMFKNEENDFLPTEEDLKDKLFDMEEGKDSKDLNEKIQDDNVQGKDSRVDENVDDNDKTETKNVGDEEMNNNQQQKIPESVSDTIRDEL